MSEQPDTVDLLVGLKLRALRKERCLTQDALARAVGVSFQQIQKYERGSNRISASRLYHIAQYFGIMPGYFFDHISSEFLDDKVSDEMMKWLATEHGVLWVRLGSQLPAHQFAAILNLVKIAVTEQRQIA